MRDFLKTKFATGVIVVITLVLAGIAIFTAIRLYQLRSESVAPTAPDTSEATSGWIECQLGEPTHDRDACRTKAEEHKGVSGPTDPSDGAWFIWAKAEPNSLSGDTACGLAPTMCAEAESCKELAFSLTAPSTTPSSTPTGTATPSPTSTPTSTPTGTPVPTATPTTPIGGGEDPTPTPTSAATATPTDSQIAQVSPTTSVDQLPAAGVGYPTIMLSLFGMLIIFFAVILAI